MNKIILIGRLTKAPEIKITSKTTIASFNIAVPRKYGEETDFFKCVAFGKQAEFAEKYLSQGMKILLEGEMQNNNFEGRDGKMIYGFQVVVNNFEFVESKNGSDNKNTSDSTAVNTNSNTTNDQFANEDGFTTNIENEDLPFSS